ncbi:hypothetical protein K469DRAFT_400765 [Zopfia rhizophila CBS 207.26]|uniref:Uncharacterized protein n=1 Tax=Zopfia rhizophila CBS 207.26 TaxID=1314779 RepID=A0A6A6DG23_9PEZI|nr:hypothetical protein K469DRAFT_400765 [Zopfia rhizophila CBS 207.26]
MNEQIRLSQFSGKESTLAPAQHDPNQEQDKTGAEHGESNSQQPLLKSFWRTGRGKDSVIAEYCRRAIKNGHTECIWLCMKRGRRCLVKDIQFKSNGHIVGLHDIRRRYSWWKSHSLYSAVGVKEVMVRFLDFDESKQEILAVSTGFDYTGITAGLDKAIEEIMELGIDDPSHCGVDVKGHHHSDKILCENTAYDEFDCSEYCKANRLRDLRIERDSYNWLPSMLEFYWQNGIGVKGRAFLETTGFVTSYDELTFDEWSDAANPYGKTVRAFMVLEGWHVRCLLLLVAAGLLLSICVVAIATAVGHSLEVGLTAGSYACGLASALIALFTFLSAAI